MNAEPVLERLARVEGRVEEHSRMVEDIAGRFTNLEARFERVDARFDHLEMKIDGVRGELDGKMTRYFTWMIGLTLASWLSLMYQFSRAVR